MQNAYAITIFINNVMITYYARDQESATTLYSLLRQLNLDARLHPRPSVQITDNPHTNPPIVITEHGPRHLRPEEIDYPF